jgi:endoglucanase
MRHLTSLRGKNRTRSCVERRRVLACAQTFVVAFIAIALAGTAIPAAAKPLRFEQPSASCTPVLGGWLHTSGAWIVDARGCEVHLVSVNWYGMETTNYVPAGLNFQPYKSILAVIKQLGFNSVRLPVSEQMVRYNSKLRVKSGYIKKDPELKGLHPLQVLDRIVAEAHRLGLLIILDNHSSAASSPRRSTIEALWNRYTQKGWIHDWETLAARYKNNPTIVGYDLRNEPHTNGPGPWTLKAYLKQGATWGKYPSKLWNPATNWPAAATKAGNALLAINPHALIFVEGVELYPDPTKKGGAEAYWWGSILKGVALEPVILKVPHQLVYSTHEWGPWKGSSARFTKKSTYKSMVKIMTANWGFITQSKDPRIQAPIWLGEFNTCNTSAKCAQNKKPGSQGLWFQWMLEYLKNNPQIGWSYFPINGTNAANQPSNNSILNPAWSKPQLTGLMTGLKKAMGQPGKLVQLRRP